MHCIRPPALSDDEIAAAAQGDADETVLEHLRQCPACAARFNEAKDFEERLGSEIYRLACPDPEQLGSFAAGTLSEPLARAVRHHLESCTLCQAEVDFIRPMFQAASPKASSMLTDLTEMIRSSVDSLVRVLTVQPIPAVRSRNPLDVHKRQLVASDPDEQFAVLLELSRAENEITISGQIILQQEALLQGAVLELSKDHTVVAAVYVNAAGEFSTSDIVPGIYDLRFTLPDASQLLLNSIDLSKLPD